MRTMILLACVAALLAGCATTYIPPGAKADLQMFAPPDIQLEFARKPSNPWPASLAVVRVQGSGYTNFNLDRYGGAYGSGKYTVIVAKELDEESQFDRIKQLPNVSGLVSVNRILLPERLEGDDEVRAAAARVQADLVLLYTFDTAFFKVNVAKPLSVVTLGMSPTKKVTATTTASALLIDTRTGYVYSAYEATETADRLSTSWSSKDSADLARKKDGASGIQQAHRRVRGHVGRRPRPPQSKHTAKVGQPS